MFEKRPPCSSSLGMLLWCAGPSAPQLDTALRHRALGQSHAASLPLVRLWALHLHLTQTPALRAMALLQPTLPKCCWHHAPSSSHSPRP